MKAKDRRRIQREAEQIRREMGLPMLDLRKLIAGNEIFRNAILTAVEQVNRDPDRKGEDRL